MECIRFEAEEKYIKDFLRLPKMLYTKKTNTENAKEMERFLRGTHALSSYFKLHKFLVYEDTKPVGRFVLTTYPEDETAYLGFFECVDDLSVAKVLFDKASEYAKELGYAKMVGPVDASFWNKYRLKINLFDRLPYTGEPYNREYYLRLFEENGFQICEHYTSNIYEALEKDNEDALYDNRYRSFQEKGYEIISPAKEDFDTVIKQLYELLTELYSDFPIYKSVSYEDFAKVFSDYRYVLNMDMVKMAYFKGQPVGFFVSVPDYGNAVYHLSGLGGLANILRVLRIRKKPKRYVMLYMGVHNEHHGLGKALVGSIMEELRISGLPSIGALARDGKITQNYGKDYISQCYEYVLLGKEL